MKIFPFLLLIGLMISGCVANEPESSETIVSYRYDTTYTFPRWRSLHKLNTAAMESDAHRAWIDLYVNDLAKEPYKRKSDRYPEGAIVLKPLFPDKERSSVARLVVMIKMEEGYDSENGDWWYGVYDKSGMEGWYSGKIASCIKCHKHAADTDYMFSQSVMEEIERQ